MNYDPSGNAPPPQQHGFDMNSPGPTSPARSVAIGEVIEEAKQNWRAHGRYVFKGYMPYFVLGAASMGAVAILRTIVTWLGVPFVGNMLQLMSMAVGVIMMALFYGMMRPLRRIFESGQKPALPGMGFLEEAKEDFVPLAIFSLAAFVAMGVGGCFLFIPMLIVQAIVYPMGFVIATEEHDIGSALPEAVEIFKANIGPLMAIVIAQLVLGGVILGPLIGIGVGAAFVGGPVLGTLVTGFAVAIAFPVILFVAWFLVGTAMVMIRAGKGESAAHIYGVDQTQQAGPSGPAW